MAKRDLVYRKGYTLLGRRLTWSGRVVSEEDWNDLTEWEKFGPNGRVFDGIKREWVKPERKEKA